MTTLQLNYPKYSPESQGLVSSNALDFSIADTYILPLLGWYDNVPAIAKSLYVDNFASSSDVTINGATNKSIIPAYSDAMININPSELAFTITGFAGNPPTVKLFTNQYPEKTTLRGNPASNIDPYWANVRYLCHFNDTTGTTSCFNEQRKTGNLTVSGAGCATTTTTSYLGVGCLTGITPSVAGISMNSAAFYDSVNNRNGTLEFFGNLNTSFITDTSYAVFADNVQNSITKMLTLTSLSADGGAMRFRMTDQNNANAVYISNTIPFNGLTGWHHYIIQINNGYMDIFIDGVLLGTSVRLPVSPLIDSMPFGLYFSVSSNTPQNFNTWQYWDELRYTKNVCRYPNGVATVPTKEYPNSAS